MPKGKPGKAAGGKPAPVAAPPAAAAAKDPARKRSGSTPALAGCVLVGLLLLFACGGLFGFLAHHRKEALLYGLPTVAAIAFLAWASARKQRMDLKRALGLAPGVSTLARRLGVPAAELRGFRPSYREMRIPKKRGGQRILHVPDDPTKRLQRLILRRVLARMKSHDAAFGFEPGRSIAHNAARHTGRAIVLRYDVVDFFPSTHAARIERMFLRFGWTVEAAALLTRLVTHEGGLPQGAPTSPRLSNLVNFGLDRELTGQIGRRHGRYTRYADDITVSFPENWIGEPERTLATVKRAFAIRGYRLHGKEKTSVRRRHQRQVVNGLVVNHHVALPRRLRRLLRAVRHNSAKGRPTTFTPEQLQGWAAFEGMVRRQGAEPPPPWVREGHPATSRRRRP